MNLKTLSRNLPCTRELFCPLEVIKNPINDHLPVGCMKIGTSFAVPKVTDLRELVPAAEPVTIVVGAFAHGSVRACVHYLGLEKSLLQ